MREHIIVLQSKDKEVLGAVRCFPGLRAAVEHDLIWVRGIFAAEEPNPNVKIRSLPAVRSFTIDANENLFPLGSITPVGKLKKMDWEAIDDLIELEMPTSALPAQVEEKYRPKLVQSSRAAEGSALLTTLDAWKAYADTAPKARLEKIKFATSGNGKVLLLGTPLPSVPGKEYWMRDNMLLPSGYDFEMPVVASLIASSLDPAKEHVLLFNEDGSWEKIAMEWFAAATRSAVRLTE